MIVVTTVILALGVVVLRLVVVRLVVLVACGVPGRIVHDDQPGVRVA